MRLPAVLAVFAVLLAAPSLSQDAQHSAGISVPTPEVSRAPRVETTLALIVSSCHALVPPREPP